MKRLMTGMAHVAPLLLAIGCGGGSTLTRDDAAQAVSGISQGAARQGLSSPTPGAAPGSVSSQCAKGGTADIRALSNNVSTTGGVSVDQKLEMKLDKCATADGAIYNGTLTVDQKVDIKAASTGGSVDVVQHTVGKLEVSGTRTDLLDIDLKQTVAVSGKATGGEVKVVLDGTVTTASGKFEFDNETIQVKSGQVFITP